MKPPKRQCKITFFLKHASLNRQGVINIFPKRHAPLRSVSLRADEWAAQGATSACGCRVRLVKFPPHDLKHQRCHSLRSSMALPPCRLARITPLPRVPPSAVYPHRHPARTARFVAHASGLAALDLMHAPQSSPAFSLRSGVSMLTAPGTLVHCVHPATAAQASRGRARALGKPHCARSPRAKPAAGPSIPW